MGQLVPQGANSALVNPLVEVCPSKEHTGFSSGIVRRDGG